MALEGVNFWSFYIVKLILGDFDPRNCLHCRAFQKSNLQKHNVFDDVAEVDLQKHKVFDRFVYVECIPWF